MISIITQDHVNTVLSYHREVTGIKYHKRKKERFAEGYREMPEEAQWLLTFCCWFSLFNFRFRQIDESRYWSIPAKEESEAAFQDFINVVRKFDRRNVTPTREKILISFLNKCSKEHQEFYLSLLSKSFTKGMPLTEIQLTLDLDIISAQILYGSVEMLKTSFADLEYPVAITGIPTPTTSVAVAARGFHSLRCLVQEDGAYRIAGKLLKNDMKYIRTPRFALAGFLTEGRKGKVKLHPFDYFERLQEFRSYLKRKEEVPYAERVEKLRRFKEHNFLTQVSQSYVGLAHSEEEVLEELSKALNSSNCDYAVLTDANTARTGQAYAVEGLDAYGIIDRFWVESGRPRGFLCWFNGELFPVEYSFEGRESSLLNDISPARLKQLNFLYVRFGEFRAGVGRTILWDQPTWRNYKLRYTNVYIEKCAFCGQTKHPHASRGVCHNCERNLYRTFEQKGPDVWIAPSKAMTKLRRDNAWEPSLLNRVRYIHQGHLVEAREDGSCRFVVQKGADDTYSITVECGAAAEDQGG